MICKISYDNIKYNIFKELVVLEMIFHKNNKFFWFDSQ